MKLQNDIMEVLKKYAKAEHQYINPNFLVEITNALSDYYDVEDDEVDEWVMNMFSC